MTNKEEVSGKNEEVSGKNIVNIRKSAIKKNILLTIRGSINVEIDFGDDSEFIVPLYKDIKYILQSYSLNTIFSKNLQEEASLKEIKQIKKYFKELNKHKKKEYIFSVIKEDKERGFYKILDVKKPGILIYYKHNRVAFVATAVKEIVVNKETGEIISSEEINRKFKFKTTLDNVLVFINSFLGFRSMYNTDYCIKLANRYNGLKFYTIKYKI